MMEEIYTILESTIAVDGSVRRAAEAKIQEIQTQPEFIRILMNLASSNEVDDRASNLSRIAGVTLKNICKKNWDEAADIQLSPELEEEIRQSIVEALFRKGKGGSQLSDAIFHIAKKDFPEKWPNLVPSLANVLSTDSMEHIELALHTLDEIFKKFRYESKSTELWTELKRVLLTVQEPLTKFYAKLVQSTGEVMKSTDQNMRRVWGDCTLAAVKIFHSLSSQDLPEYFEDNLKTWAEGFQVLIDGAQTSEHTSHAEQIKAEIFDICTLYAQRYEEEFSPFIQGCLNAAWKTLVETNDDTKNDQMICSALEFISSIAAKVQYAELFNDEVLEKITENICIRALRLREVDIDLWEDDAVEYLTQDLQGSNIGTRRRGAVDLVRSLYRRFSEKLTVLLTRVLGQLVSSGDWKSIDVLYSLVNAICSRTETAKEGATSTNSFIDVCDFYRNQVRVHLSHPLNEFPMLKADALKFAVTFRGQLQPEMLVETVNFCGQLLLADKAILHKYSAYCIEKLLLMKTADNAGPLLTAQCVDVAQLLQNLVAGFKKDPKAQHTPYLMKAILRVIAILDENTARHGGDIASELAQLVEASTKTPADPVHTHFLFESICLLVQKTAKLEGFSGLDEQLMPLVAVILSSDNQDLIPYALQVTGVLLSAAIVRGNISSHFTSFVPFLLSADLWKRTANVPAALSVLEVYLKHTPELVLSEHASLVFQQYVRLIGNKSLDKYGFQLAGALIPVLEKIQGIEDPVKLIWNHMFQRIQSAKTPLFVKQFVVYIARWAIVRGADQLVKALASIQANIFSMVMDRVVLAAFRDNLKNMATATDKRTIVIGFAKVIAESPAQLGSQYGDLAHCLVELVESVSASDRHTMTPEEEQASMYNAEGEFTNPYCRLSYAPKAELLAPEVSSYKAVLAQALLHTAPHQDSSYLNCLLTEDVHRLRQYF